MAKTDRERVKRMTLLAFLVISVGLIGLIWADGLTPDEPATPAYYRDTFEMDEDVYLTITAEAVQFRQTMESGTPEPPPESSQNGRGTGGGRGQGGGQNRGPAGTPQPGE